MLSGWFRGRRERAEAIKREADALQAEFGDLAYSRASERTRVKGMTDKDLAYAWNVRREIADRIGHRIGYDNATARLADNGDA